MMFGRTINNIPAANFIQLNSMRVATNTIYPSYPAYSDPYANPYPPIPWYENQLPNQLQPQQAQQINPIQLQQQQLMPNLHIPGIVPLNPPAMPPAMPRPQFRPINPMANQMPNLPMGPQRPILQPAQLRPPIPQQPPQAPAAPLPDLQQLLITQAAARQEAAAAAVPAAGAQTPPAAAGTGIVPQPITPDADWLLGLPLAAQEMRSPTSDEYQTPVSTPGSYHSNNDTPSRDEAGAAALPMHVSGDQAAWEIPKDVTPTHSVDFNELPTNTPIFVHHQRRMARIGNEIMLVRNHPEDIIPQALADQFQNLAVHQETGAKQKTVKAARKSSKDKIKQEQTRASSRTRKQTDFYVAGLNSIQTTRGYVDSSGRYRSYSRDRNDQRPTSNQGYSRPQSRSDSRARLRTPSNRDGTSSKPDYKSSDYRKPSQSPYRAKSPYSSQNNQNSSAYRRQSQSPYRAKSPYSSQDRPGREQYKNSFQSRDRSGSTRKLYPLMQKGLNCRSDYDPGTMKNCTKCMKNGHHEFECSKYFKYSHSKCTLCHKMMHYGQDCKEVKEFPPGVTPKN
jgi:hypothetical protein